MKAIVMMGLLALVLAAVSSNAAAAPQIVAQPSPNAHCNAYATGGVSISTHVSTSPLDASASVSPDAIAISFDCKL